MLEKNFAGAIDLNNIVCCYLITTSLGIIERLTDINECRLATTNREIGLKVRCCEAQPYLRLFAISLMRVRVLYAMRKPARAIQVS